MPDQPLNQRIHIERLVIRTRGLPESTLRAVLAGLDTALLAEVSRHPGMHQAHSHTLDLTPALIQARGDSQHLRQAIAHQVIHTIASPSSPPPSAGHP